MVRPYVLALPGSRRRIQPTCQGPRLSFEVTFDVLECAMYWKGISILFVSFKMVDARLLRVGGVRKPFR